MSRCKANPCCGDPAYCEVPMPQDRTGLYYLNERAPAATPDAPPPSPQRELEERIEALQRENDISLTELGKIIMTLPSGTRSEGALAGVKALKAKLKAAEETLSFVWRWTWYKEGNGTSDAERLSAIKHHPGIAALNPSAGEGDKK